MKITRKEIYYMNLKEVLIGIEGIKAKGNLNIDIKNITTDSRKVNEGDMFIAIKGFEVDGHEYIEKAIEKGANTVVVQEGYDYKNILCNENITLIMVPDSRIAEAVCASNFYGRPQEKLKVVGVTGTKGKTTTTFMIKEILEKQGKKVGLIGTVATYINGRKVEDSDRTTPDSIHLFSLLGKMVDEGTEIAVMEVSSQSLKLNRVYGIQFDIGVFTNLSEDHISPKEHPNIEDYFESKLKMFDTCKIAYVNADDLYGQKVIMSKKCEIKTFGIDNDANNIAKDITITNTYADFKQKLYGKNERIKVGIPGRFSIYNALGAICVATNLEATVESIKEALENIKVPGRSELVENKKDLTIMIDYAHSPKSLESILKAVSAYTRGRVISVFGCGGDRDTAKRPMMGEISGKIAEYTIITSDNPRTEDPKEIIKQIENGIKTTKGKYECIVDRREAIKKAIKMANKNDIIVLAGKGHEPYQEIEHKKYPFDERIIVNEIIEGMEKK
jgi:UDP-N-acetylmuramoyl-L-alanyl-D-glutamate--2,6-diaminopimelate ligase